MKNLTTISDQVICELNDILIDLDTVEKVLNNINKNNKKYYMDFISHIMDRIKYNLRHVITIMNNDMEIKRICESMKDKSVLVILTKDEHITITELLAKIKDSFFRIIINENMD